MATKKKLVSNKNNDTYFSQKISKKTMRKPLCNTMNNIYSMLDEKTYKPLVGTDVIGRVFGKKAQKEFQKVNIANRLKGFKRKGNGTVGGKQSGGKQRVGKQSGGKQSGGKQSRKRHITAKARKY